MAQSNKVVWNKWIFAQHAKEPFAVPQKAIANNRTTVPPPPGHNPAFINDQQNGNNRPTMPPPPGYDPKTESQKVAGILPRPRPDGRYEISLLGEVFQEAENEFAAQEFEDKDDQVPPTKRSAVTEQVDRAAVTRREGNAAKPKSYMRPSYNWTPNFKEFESSVMQEIFMEAEF